MSSSFFESQLCKSRERCRQCRRSRDYRRGVVAAFDEPDSDEFECPFGKSADDFPQDIEPNIFKMGVNFGASMIREAGARVKKGGKRRVSQEERESRMEICRGCEFLKGSRCAKCGCVMKFKTRLLSGKCPIGKW